MTRATRVAIGSSVLTFFYLLAFFSYIPVPFVDQAQTEQVLPVVRGATHYSDISDAYPFTSGLLHSCPGGCLCRLVRIVFGRWGRACTHSGNVRMRIPSC